MHRTLPLLLALLTLPFFARGSEPEDTELKTKAEGGDTSAQIMLGVMCLEGGDFDGAESWYLKALQGGNKDAEEYLATFYDYPNNPQNDVEKAFKWRLVVAERGDSNSQVLLGNMYEMGSGVGPNAREAAKWYLAAAKQGNSAGASHLSHLYSRGDGVREDKEQAYVWARVSEELQKRSREKLPEEIKARRAPVSTTESAKLAKDLSPAKLHKAESDVEKLIADMPDDTQPTKG
jgi:TPR repeat protein